MNVCRLLVPLVALIAPLSAAELVPVEKFAADLTSSRARLSPDGKTLAFINETNSKQWLMMLDLVTKKTARIDPGNTITGIPREVVSFRWVSEKRISYISSVWDGMYFSGVSAVDRDGKYWKTFSGPDADPTSSMPLLAVNIIYAFGDKDQNVLMLDRGSGRGNDLLYQDVIKVSTLLGDARTVVKNPGNVIGWVVDRHGVVRLGITRAGKRYGAIFREDEKTPWRDLPLFDEKLGRVRPLGFDVDGRRLFVSVTNESKRHAVHYYDPIEGKLGELIASHEHYDIIPELGAPSADGVSLSGPISSELAGTLVGIRFMTEGPHTRWFDPGFAILQEAVDKFFPDTVNLITSRSRDEKRFLILSYSDREPGIYHVLDLEADKPVLTRVGARVADFPTDKMAPMYPIKYQARDGEQIEGYLTLPLGQKKNLPLVVMPHGGPNVRDVWGYDPMVQFLANRGYAVLQMNYRGSPGYGTEFYAKGKREIGKGIQTDIDDGTRWAVAQGFADPKRVAILGGSYGGYSALFALGNSPELYRCGVSINGVTDWAEMFKSRKDEEYKFAYQHFQEWIGDPKDDAAMLASISPVNFADKIKAPLYIFQGKDDRVVPPRQARKLVDALEKAGRPPKVLYFPKEGHGFRSEKNRAKMFREIEAFLGQHLAPASGT